MTNEQKRETFLSLLSLSKFENALLKELYVRIAETPIEQISEDIEFDIIEELIEEIDSLTVDVKKAEIFEETILNLEEEIGDLEDDNSKLENKCEELEDTISDLEAEIDNAKDQIKELEAEIEKLSNN